MRRAVMALLAASLAGCAAQPVSTPELAAPAGVIPPGLGQVTAVLGGVPMQLFTFRPAGCTPASVLLVFHGLQRNAAGYRDDAVPLGQRDCMLVVAPLFDAARFATWQYQRGGIVHRDVLQPPDRWTVAFVPRLVDWLRVQEAQPELRYAMIGHSAGAQFLSRVMAFGDGAAVRAVIANPSTWVRASLDVPVPYGFGGLAGADAGAALRRYLAAPITVLLGQDDTGSRNLATSDEAEEQGATRLARGQMVFTEAQAVAREHGWPFGWQLAIVPGTGHDPRRMFTSDQAFAALPP